MSARWGPKVEKLPEKEHEVSSTRGATPLLTLHTLLVAGLLKQHDSSTLIGKNAAHPTKPGLQEAPELASSQSMFPYNGRNHCRLMVSFIASVFFIHENSILETDGLPLAIHSQTAVEYVCALHCHCKL